MPCDIEHFLLNYGWEHSWCSPKISKNFIINEVIKGPFTKPKLVKSVPYVTVCQLDGSVIRLSEGIPDCWAEYLNHSLRLFQNNELMHKEDVDIVPRLRKDRLYLGQGIPNPWTSYIDDFQTFLHESLENLKKHSNCLSHYKKFKNNSKKEPCFCCSKKYLFKCPDSSGTNSCCSFENRHCKNAPAIDCTVKCKNIKILPNRPLKRDNLKLGKKKGSKESSESNPPSSEGSSSAADDEDENSDKKHETHNQRNKFPKKQSRMCSCPYIKNFYLKKVPLKNKNENENDILKRPVLASKLIQTELQPLKSSKSVQTDGPKIQCCTKCFWCNISQCNLPWGTSCKQINPARWCEAGSQPICTVPSFCFPASCPQNSAFVCPYYFSNHFMTYKSHKEKSTGLNKKASKKKQLKERESEDDLKTGFSYNVMQVKANEALEHNMKWNNTDQGMIKPNCDVSKNYKYIDSCSKLTKTFDHMKYLTDDKLKHYLQQEEIFPKTQSNKFIHQSPFSDFKSTDFDKGNSTFCPARVQLERFESFSCSTPKHFKSFPPSKPKDADIY